jgi:hypothetical protein
VPLLTLHSRDRSSRFLGLTLARTCNGAVDEVASRFSFIELLTVIDRDRHPASIAILRYRDFTNEALAARIATDMETRYDSPREPLHRVPMLARRNPRTGSARRSWFVPAGRLAVQ